MNLANRLTLARMGLTPLFAVLIAWQQTGGGERARWAALGCFGAAAVLDGLDGYVARRFNQRTELGAMLDPLADKVLLFVALTLLTFRVGPGPALPWWLWSSVTFRDTLLGAWAARFLRERRRWGVVKPRWTGKAATAMQMGAVLWSLLPAPRAGLTGLCAAGATLTIFSGLQYLADGRRVLAEEQRVQTAA